MLPRCSTNWPWFPKQNKLCPNCVGAGSFIVSFKPFTTKYCLSCDGVGVLAKPGPKIIQGGKLITSNNIDIAAKNLKKALGKAVKVWAEDGIIKVKIYKGNPNIPKKVKTFPVEVA